MSCKQVVSMYGLQLALGEHEGRPSLLERNEPGSSLL